MLPVAILAILKGQGSLFDKVRNSFGEGFASLCHESNFLNKHCGNYIDDGSLASPEPPLQGQAPTT